MNEIIFAAKRKIVALLTVIFIVLTAVGAFSFFSVRGGLLVRDFMAINERLMSTEGAVKAFAPRVDEAKRMGSILANVKYPNVQTLRETLFRELEGMSLKVTDISLRERASDGISTAGVIEVVASGTILFGEIPKFMKEISSRPRIWGVETLEINPRTAPAELISQFIMLHRRGDKRGVELFLQQGKEFLESKSSSIVDVKMKFIVVGG